MAITQDVVQAFYNRAVLNVVSHLWDVGKSLPFSRSYFTADAAGDRLVYPGMVVCDAGDEYVPANSSASYGSYSYYAYASGVLYTMYDESLETQIVAPATRAALVEANCYIFGGTMGVIPDAVKTAAGMKLIQWD